MTESRLKKVLSGGGFAVTAECGPPKGADPEVIRKKGDLLKAYVDSVNVTDNQTGVVRLSSMAACAILKEMGLDPVLQIVTRDRNRIALQSDVLGATSRMQKGSLTSTACNCSRRSGRCGTAVSLSAGTS
jgi:methylenetetrahydrofolate reductase (NADPH)